MKLAVGIHGPHSMTPNIFVTIVHIYQNVMGSLSNLK